MECAWFVFSDLIQVELDDLVYRWNSHYIRKSRANVIGGIPNEMFYLPEGFGFVECGKEISDSDIRNITQQRDILSE